MWLNIIKQSCTHITIVPWNYYILKIQKNYNQLIPLPSTNHPRVKMRMLCHPKVKSQCLTFIQLSNKKQIIAYILNQP